jgi:hypothetical protein
LPTVAAGDQRLVPELLKRHLYLEVSAISMINLDEYIFDLWLTEPVLPRYQGIPVAVSGDGDVMSHVCISQPLARARVIVFEAAGGCYVLR